MANGTPLFLGNSNVEQLLEFFKVLGSPSKLDLLKMNPEFDSSEYKLPELKPRDWRKVLRKTDSQLVDLVSRLLVYDPGARLTARQALQH
jgi:serine/threonine protein kinase